MTAIVYIVAGLSSRFEGKIKQFAVVRDNGETLIEVSLNQAIKAGFDKIVFIVGKKTEQPFKEKFGDNYKGIPIVYAFQDYDEDIRDKPWGTTDALCAGREVINEPFVVCNGDDIYGVEKFRILVEHLKNNNEEATTGTLLDKHLPEKGKNNRGMFEIENNYVKSIKETFDIERDKLEEMGLKLDDWSSANIFALHPSVLILLDENLKDFKENHQGDRKAECLLPDEISKLLQESKIKMKFYESNERESESAVCEK